ncbi:MAG: hypothetical protein QOD56_2199, partial [Gammaproteobacteria bacterium]|nr:hypothetical protein [Gammaproteobacteria bacterium]
MTTRGLNAASTRRFIALALLVLPAGYAAAQASLPAVAIKTAADGAQSYSLTF